jgi:DNA-binding IclR family transcriptional regulator
MAASVPAVERANRILQHLAASPQQCFSAAEVAAAVGVHRATCFSILAVLADAGLVDRDAVRKTYRLGPELVRLGAAACGQYRGFPDAKREMYALTRELDAGGLVCATAGGEIVILERIGEHDDAFDLPRVGQAQVPFAPPVGGIFVAWSPSEVIEAWLDRAPADASAEDIESYRRSLPAIRARGYSIGSLADVQLQLKEVLARLESGDATERLTVALELADYIRRGRVEPPGGRRGGADGRNGSGRLGQFDHIVAPVFDANCEVAMTLTLYGRPEQITEDNVSTYADPLMEAAARVTRAANGRWPS